VELELGLKQGLLTECSREYLVQAGLQVIRNEGAGNREDPTKDLVEERVETAQGIWVDLDGMYQRG